MTAKTFEEWATNHGVVEGTEEYLLCQSAWQSGQLAQLTDIICRQIEDREKAECESAEKRR